VAIPLKQLIAQLTAGNGKWTPYDPALNSLIGSAQSRLGQLHSSYAKNVNRTKIDYGRQNRDLTQEQGRALDANKEDWVGRGLGRSGIFAHSQGEVGQDYQKRLQALAAERTRTLEGYSQAKASGETDLRESLMQGQADAANRYTAKKQADAQAAAEAKHNQAMLELQRQQVAAQLEAARAQANAFRGGMGPGGQVFPENSLSAFAGMDPATLQYLQVMRYLQALQAQGRGSGGSRGQMAI
jgi:hypothetical protein